MNSMGTGAMTASRTRQNVRTSRTRRVEGADVGDAESVTDMRAPHSGFVGEGQRAARPAPSGRPLHPGRGG
jgi:hypothetical protein